MQYHLDTALDLKSAATDGHWGRFTGIASTSDEDFGGDIVEPGAFAPICTEHVAMCLQHDTRAPIGRWEALEPQAGGRRLLAKGAIRLTLAKGREAWEMIRERIITGLSIGFRTEPGDVVRDKAGKRRIRKGMLLEISLVTLPMNGDCRVIETHSLDGFSSLEQRLAALEAADAAQSLRQQERLIALESRLAQCIEQEFKSGAIPGAQAEMLLRSILNGQRASRHL